MKRHAARDTFDGHAADSWILFAVAFTLAGVIAVHFVCIVLS